MSNDRCVYVRIDPVGELIFLGASSEAKSDPWRLFFRIGEKNNYVSFPNPRDMGSWETVKLKIWQLAAVSVTDYRTDNRFISTDKWNELLWHLTYPRRQASEIMGVRA
jgi:hypothetical protein